MTPGLCYAECLARLLGSAPTKNGINLMLCHGYPCLTKGPHQGQRYGHAWLEYEEFDQVWIWDHASPETPFHQRLYYHVGRVNPDHVKRYTPAEAAELAIEHEHPGPWEEIPVGVLFTERGLVVQYQETQQDEFLVMNDRMAKIQLDSFRRAGLPSNLIRGSADQTYLSARVNEDMFRQRFGPWRSHDTDSVRKPGRCPNVVQTQENLDVNENQNSIGPQAVDQEGEAGRA